MSGGMCGCDREGSPVWYEVIGPLDAKGLLFSASKQDLLKNKFRDCELLQRECEQQSQKVGARLHPIPGTPLSPGTPVPTIPVPSNSSPGTSHPPAPPVPHQPPSPAAPVPHQPLSPTAP